MCNVGFIILNWIYLWVCDHFAFESNISPTSVLLEPLERNKADGALLLRMDEAYAVDVLQIRHTLKRRRLMRLLDRLKVHQMEHKKV